MVDLVRVQLGWCQGGLGWSEGAGRCFFEGGRGGAAAVGGEVREDGRVSVARGLVWGGYGDG